MEFKEENKIVEIDGNEYQVLNELNFRGEVGNGKQRPYLRRNTKLNIFRTIRSSYPEMYIRLCEQPWYSAYKKEVEGTPEIKFAPGVREKLEGDGTNNSEGTDADQANNKLVGEIAEVFGSVVNKLSENMADMSNKISQMNTNTKLEEALLEGIITKGKEIAVEELRDELRANLQDYIKETYGQLPDRIIITKEDVEYEKQGLFHKDFEKILKLVNIGLPVMLTGGAGAGKNFMLEQVSEAMNMSFYYTSTITQEYKLTGFIDGGGKFHETEFYKAFTQGGIFMLDEIDASIPECLVILNGAIANGYFDFPTGREIAHEDFRVVCAGNTVGLGADMVYTGRNVLDGATLDRFVLVEIDYDPRIEENLCQDEELRNFLYDFRKSVQRNKIQHIIGMRCFKYSYELLVNGFDKEFIVKSVVTKGLQKDDINVIKANLNSENIWYEYIR